MNDWHDQDDDDRDALAKGMMDLAQKRLLKDLPFHARFVAGWQVRSTRTVATAAVTVRYGDILLLYNPDFVVRCTLPQLEGVLHHEVNHVLFEHIFADPQTFPDERAWIIAIETSANEWVAGPLPGEPITLDQFPHLPPDEDALTRYARLAQDPGQPPSKFAAGVPNIGRAGPKSVGSGPKNRRRERNDHAQAPSGHGRVFHRRLRPRSWPGRRTCLSSGA